MHRIVESSPGLFHGWIGTVHCPHDQRWARQLPLTKYRSTPSALPSSTKIGQGQTLLGPVGICAETSTIVVEIGSLTPMTTALLDQHFIAAVRCGGTTETSVMRYIQTVETVVMNLQGLYRPAHEEAVSSLDLRKSLVRCSSRRKDHRLGGTKIKIRIMEGSTNPLSRSPRVHEVSIAPLMTRYVLIIF